MEQTKLEHKMAFSTPFIVVLAYFADEYFM